MAPSTTALAALATHYITYVVTRSEFPPVRWGREQILDRTREGSAAAYLITCSYCTAAYVAAGVVVALDIRGDVRWPVLLGLACASIAGTLVEAVDTLRSVSSKMRS